MSKEKSTFKQYYDSNPEFRKRHLEKLKKIVICECGFETSICNLKRHQQSRNHEKRLFNGQNLDNLIKLRESIDKNIKLFEKYNNKK